MRRFIILTLAALFFNLISNPAFALSCGRPTNYVVAECQQDSCTRAFKVGYKGLRNQCQTQVLVTVPDAGELHHILKLIQASSANEQSRRVVVFYGRGKDAPTEPDVYKDSDGKFYTYWLYGALDGEQEYLGARPPRPYQWNAVKGKSYDALETQAQESARRSLQNKIMFIYLVPLVLYPLAMAGAAYCIARVRRSRMPWYAKAILCLPPAIVLFGFFASFLLSQDAHPFIQWSPPVTLALLAVYYARKKPRGSDDK